MKKLPALLTVAAILLIHGSAFAIGGNGATCNPSTQNWGNCELVPVPFQSSVTKTINIPGGNHSTPFQATQANTRYALQGNMTADGTAIEVKANYVIIDLNGYTITYNRIFPGEGVTVGAYNLHHLAVRNGSIIQGATMSEGDQYGRGNNPVGTYNTALGGNRSASNLHVANLYVRYGGRDVGGIICAGGDGLYEQNTIEDTYEFGTLKNRHQGVEALTGSKNITATGNVYRKNTIINTRHRGIVTGNSAEVYGNHISIRSIATNAVGVSQYAGRDISIHNNTIIGRGEHPIGVGAGGGSGSYNVDIYDNIMDMQTTALGEEYGSSYLSAPTATYIGNSAAGIRLTWEANDIVAYNNQISITTSSKFTGTYSPTGATAYINGGGKGLFVGVANPSSTASFYNNNIHVNGDGSYTYGVTCSYNFSDGLFIYNNIITSSQYNIVIGDDYGACNGYPLFKGNILVKTGDNQLYKTIINTYSDTDRHSQVRFVDNYYQNGADEKSILLRPQSLGLTNIYFGTENKTNNNEHIYNYRLHDNNGTSSTLLREDFSPAITLNYRSPGTTSLPENQFPIILKITTK